MSGTHLGRENYDAIVIGSGQAGGPLAIEFARAGLQTALLEESGRSGASVEIGCEPSLSQIASANITGMVCEIPEFGTVQLCKQAVTAGSRVGVTRTLSDTPGLTVFKGDVRFDGAQSLLVHEGDDSVAELRANRIFINTGARPALPHVPGLDAVPYLTSSSAMDLGELPEDLLILGGSYLGVELGQMFRRFGSRVSIIERGAQLLAREDRDIAAAVAEILREDGVEVFLETDAIGVDNDCAGGVKLKVRTPSGEHVLAGSRLLVVAGREPNTDGLDLSAAGIAVDARGYIKVNERLETSARGVYALGGVNGGPGFMHVAHDESRTICANVLDSARTTKSGRTRAYTAFTDPQLGRIGLTESEAREQGRAVKVAKRPMKRAQATASNVSRGLMKVVVDNDTDRIIGAAALGIDSGEIIAMLQVAMMANMPYTALCDGMSAHPSLARPLGNLFAALDG